MSMLFAATHPDRTTHLILWSSMARTTWAPDYPWVAPKEALLESSRDLLRPTWGEGTNIEIWMPSRADDPLAVEKWGRYERQAASPGKFVKLVQMSLDIDVRHVLPAIRVPTLHRHGDRVVNVDNGRYVAEHIPGARFVEFNGIDHALEAGNTDAVLDEIEEFLTGVAPRAGGRTRALDSPVYRHRRLDRPVGRRRRQAVAREARPARWDFLAADGRITTETAAAQKAEARARIAQGTFFGFIGYASMIGRKP
jgi:hypothetical protein